MIAAVSIGPVSVAIEADQTIFQSYSSGIISNISCGQKLDHGVLIVGFTKGYLNSIIDDIYTVSYF